MEKRKITHSKIEGFSGIKNDHDNFSVIVKVNKPDYIPAHVKLRSKIDPYTFTADATGEALKQLEGDAAVASVSISHPLPGIK